MTADFDSFYAAEYPKVYRAARSWTGDHQRALDATQEAFAKALARWGRLAKEDWAAGWVVTTALNLCKKAPKVAPRRSTQPRDRIHLAQQRMDVATALSKLSDRQREAAVLFYIGDLPLPAVAHLMQLSEGTVKSHLARARKTLKDLLEVRDD
jgi:RNA polymerase sigma factor (sigma-70 family)